MKYVKFTDNLIPLILKGQKYSTWRINDEKNIQTGDEISLQHNDGTEFARARVISVKMTTFLKLTLEDRKGHEEFSSDDEMYRKYSEYYKIKVKPTTQVKIIKFKLFTQSNPYSLFFLASRRQ